MTPQGRLAAALITMMLVVMACMDLSGPDSSTYFTPTPSNPGSPPLQPPVTAPVPPPPFPTVANASAIYLGPENLYDFVISYHGSRLPSRYVFFGDSTFQLQFASHRFGIFQYAGRYSRTDSAFTFTWEVSSVAWPWVASATSRGDTLDIRYNDIMVHTDFVDGRYVLVR